MNKISINCKTACGYTIETSSRLPCSLRCSFAFRFSQAKLTNLIGKLSLPVFDTDKQTVFRKAACSAVVDTGCLVSFQLQRLQCIRQVVLGECLELLQRQVEWLQIHVFPQVSIASNAFPAAADPVTNERNRFSK